MKNSFKDLTGNKYNNLTVLNLSYKSGNHRNWLCKCDCGSIKEYREDHILRGETKSCGCLRKELASNRARKNLGFSGLINDLYTIYRRRIIKKGMLFSLTRVEFSSLISGNCFYCGSSPKNVLTNGKIDKEPLVYNGIDRLDNSKGYISDNIVTCCKVCNYAKHTMSLEEFLNWIESVHTHLSNKNLL